MEDVELQRIGDNSVNAAAEVQRAVSVKLPSMDPMRVLHNRAQRDSSLEELSLENSAYSDEEEAEVVGGDAELVFGGLILRSQLRVLMRHPSCFITRDIFDDRYLFCVC